MALTVTFKFLFIYLFNIICQIGLHTTSSAHPNKCPLQCPSPTFPSPTLLKFFLMFIYIWERESTLRSTSRGGAERERWRQNMKQVSGSELSAQSPMWGSNSWAVRSWPELKLDTQLTEPPRHPMDSINSNRELLLQKLRGWEKEQKLHSSLS